MKEECYREAVAFDGFFLVGGCSRTGWTLAGALSLRKALIIAWREANDLPASGPLSQT